MDTEGNQLIPWENITSEDVVVTPAFGTTIKIKELLESKGVPYKPMILHALS